MTPVHSEHIIDDKEEVAVELKHLILNKRDRIATITLNRPRSRNAVNARLAEDLEVVMADLYKDDDIRVVILTGAGETFCAGGDFQYGKIGSGDIDVELAHDNLPAYEDMAKGKYPPGWVNTVLLPLLHLDKPTIAMVNGPAVGAGLDLSLACDIRIGTPGTRFIVGFTRVGLPDDMGGCWLLPKIVGLGRALEILYTSDPIDGEEAHRIGLLNKLVPDKSLEKETLAFATRLAQGPPMAYRLIKSQVYRSHQFDMETALMVTMSLATHALHSQDHKEGIRAWAEKRPPDFQGR